MGDVLWKPDAGRVGSARITRFIERVRAEHDPTVIDYPSLHAFSLRSPDTFWRLLGALDADRHGGGEFGPALLLAVLYLRLIERELETRGLGSTLEEAEPRAVIEVTGDVLATLTVPAVVPSLAAVAA